MGQVPANSVLGWLYNGLFDNSNDQAHGTRLWYRLRVAYQAEFPTWHVLDCGPVRPTGELFARGARQIDRRDEDLRKAASRIRLLREKNKESFDERQTRQDDKALQQGDLVLLDNTDLETRYNRKLTFRRLTLPDHLGKSCGAIVPRGSVYGSRLERTLCLPRLSI